MGAARSSTPGIRHGDLDLNPTGRQTRLATMGRTRRERQIRLTAGFACTGAGKPRVDKADWITRPLRLARSLLRSVAGLVGAAQRKCTVPSFCAPFALKATVRAMSPHGNLAVDGCSSRG
jgi:hypothetical protein